jgi:dTDP-4-amino-4,6-dideoxygalactose transaminase
MEFRDLKKQYHLYSERLNRVVQDVFSQTSFISGLEVKSLETRLAKYVGVKHCVTCANGTDALALVLKAWGIGPGDAVFVPDFTFFATAEVVSLVGATPVFVDVDANTYNIDTDDLMRKVRQTQEEGVLSPRVVIPVDLFGLLADYEQIQLIADEFGLLVLEDAAQGFGAEFEGKRAGSFGHAATTSFFPAKPLGCYGDGGAIFTNDNELAELLKSLRVHGKGIDKYDNVRVGYNSRLDTIQAAILHVKLDAFIAHELADVNQAYRMYNERLQGHVIVPSIPEGHTSSFAQYTIQLPSEEIRDGLRQYLSSMDIPSMIYYVKGMHAQTAFVDLGYKDEDFPVTSKLCETVLSLPMHPYLSEEDINLVSSSIIEYLKNQ